METLPEKSCTNCNFFKKKNHLTRNNQIATKEYCLKFDQELFSHNFCPKFRYADEVEIDVDTIYGTIGGISGIVMVVSFIIVIVAAVVKAGLVLDIALIIGVTSMISLIIFMLIDDNIKKKILYENQRRINAKIMKWYEAVLWVLGIVVFGLLILKILEIV